MNTETDGGSAFPLPISKANYDTTPQDFLETGTCGMSLRDWFAGMALQGILACDCKMPANITPDNVDQYVAEEAYASADAMLKAREQ